MKILRQMRGCPAGFNGEWDLPTWHSRWTHLNCYLDASSPMGQHDFVNGSSRRAPTFLSLLPSILLLIWDENEKKETLFYLQGRVSNHPSLVPFFFFFSMEKSRSFPEYSSSYSGGGFRCMDDRSNSYSFNGPTNKVTSSDPEMKRKKRVASYNLFTVEGKVKSSVRGSFKWIKTKFSEIRYGAWAQISITTTPPLSYACYRNQSTSMEANSSLSLSLGLFVFIHFIWWVQLENILKNGIWGLWRIWLRLLTITNVGIRVHGKDIFEGFGVTCKGACLFLHIWLWCACLDSGRICKHNQLCSCGCVGIWLWSLVQTLSSKTRNNKTSYGIHVLGFCGRGFLWRLLQD